MSNTPESYPESDFPYTFYFNGIALPKWSQVWHACKLYDWIEKSYLPQLEHIAIDHVGDVASADPVQFSSLVLRLLATLIENGPTIHDNCAQYLSFYPHFQNVRPDEVVNGVSMGLQQMFGLAHAMQIAFWCAGYEEDQALLAEYMRRHRLPKDHPDFFESPHITRVLSHARIEYSAARNKLIQLVQAGGVPKDLRKWIHEIPVT